MSGSNKNTQKGIDIQEALSILSVRTESSSYQNDENGCGCCGGQVPKNAKQMGQTIDLFGEQTGEPEVNPKQTKEDSEEEEKMKQERAKKRREEIQLELNKMSERELLQAILKTQEDRVKTYREYER